MKNQKSSADKHLGEEVLNHEVALLMKQFLHEVYRQIQIRKINKAALASLVNVSPGYLSKIFNGQKPLTFKLLVKFQQALHIEFEIKVKPKKQ